MALNAAYWDLVQITKPWTAFLFSVLRYRGSNINEIGKFFKKKLSIFSRKTIASYVMTETLLVQNLAYILAVCLEGEWFLYLSSVLRNMTYNWEKIFRHFFSSLFLPKKPSLKKILTLFLGENVAHEIFVNYTQPRILNLVLVLRNRGSNKKQSKVAFFQNFFFKKKTMKPIFFEIFFNENVAQEPAQLLAETWCPYLLWVLRNLPHKFEKLAHVTKSAKKT